MGWYPCRECCCECSVSNNCPCPCIGKNPCTTTLTVTGNHPATLRFPITYQRNTPSGFCGLNGCSPVNRSQSTGDTQLRTWYEKERLWDRIERDVYYCCESPGTSGTAYIVRKEEGKGVRVASRCFVAGVRYLNLEVSTYQSYSEVYQQQPLCGIIVEAKLTFQRFFQYKENKCEYKYGKKSYYDQPPCILPDPGWQPYSEERTCSYCMNEDGTISSFTPNEDYSTQPYPNVNCPDPVWEADIPPDYDGIDKGIRCIIRRKFIPGVNDIACSGNPLVVSLAPENTFTDGLFGPKCCGKTEKFGDDLVYYDYLTPQDRYCDAESPSICGIPITSPKVRYGTWLPGGWPSFGDLAGTGINCIPQNVQGFVIPECVDFSNEVTRVRGTNLVRELANHTLLFGEMNDTWTLNISCSG